MERLDKAVAGAFLLSRTQAQGCIRAGRVKVLGQVCLRPEAKVERGQVELDGQAASAETERYLMLHKPAGYLSATEDKRDSTVLDLLPEGYARAGLQIVGRLDKDTEGLLLLTSDGALNHALTSPRRHVDKRYYVELDGPACADDIGAFARGIDLGDFTSLPAELEIDPVNPCHCQVVVREGKFHQVKRMFAARGRQVTYLKRFSMGNLELDPGLSPGEWRPLSQAELESLRKLIGIIP